MGLMKILVTGSDGFIGSHLMQALRFEKKKHDWKVVGIDKKRNVDITEWKKLLDFTRKRIGKPDLIVHLAATCSTQASIDRPDEDFGHNVIGSFNICELARWSASKVLYTSTCKVKPNKEGSRAPYGLSKLVGEMYLREYSLDYGLEYVINRPGTIYGPGQEGSPESGWLAWFIKASKEKLPITIYGDGKQVRDVLWVEDYVELLIDQIKHWNKYKGGIYSVGGGKRNAVNLLTVLKLLKYGDYKFDSVRVGDVKRFVSDNREVGKVNGWKPKMGWIEGINITNNLARKTREK